VPFETLIGDRLVRGRIDAVFADARTAASTWSTGRPAARPRPTPRAGPWPSSWPPTGSPGRRWPGSPSRQVRAAFYYVRDDQTVRPADLLDEAGLTAGVLGDQHGLGPRFQHRLEDVRHVARVADVVARAELGDLAGRADQGPARADHDVLHHAGRMRLEARGVPGLGRDAVHVAADPRRAGGEQRGLVVGLRRGDRRALVRPDHLGARPRRVEQPGERHVQRDADRPQRLQAGVAGAGLQLGQRGLGDPGAAGDLGQRQPGPVPLPAQRGGDALQAPGRQTPGSGRVRHISPPFVLTNDSWMPRIGFMSSIRRTLEGSVRRDIALTCLAVLFIGLSYGAIAVASGLPLWLPVAQSVFVVAGASEFLFIGIVAAGGNPIAAALAGLLVNARHLPYGLALPPDITGRGWRRISAPT
jgi:hypothetical protein